MWYLFKNAKQDSDNIIFSCCMLYVALFVNKLQ